MLKRLVVDESLLLDLLNSTPMAEQRVEDVLADPDRACAWLQERGGSGAEAERLAVARARDRLQDVVLGNRSHKELEPILEGASQMPSFDDHGLMWRLDAPDEHVLAVRAVLAWARMGDELPDRLRPCGNPDCRLFFVDRSAARSGRWCSMAVCGNRMKARRHHERNRSHD